VEKSNKLNVKQIRVECKAIWLYLWRVEILSKAKQSVFKRLADKKFRSESGLCAAEGFKCIEDCIRLGWKPEWIAVDSKQQERVLDFIDERFPVFLLPDSGLSFLDNPTGLVAVFKIPEQSAYPESGPVVILDGLQDPGNLGTILRTCHWFGVSDVLLLKGTTDPFAPKVIQSSMGSIAALNIHRMDVDQLKIWKTKTEMELWVAQVGGTSILDIENRLGKQIAWVIGNEGKGVHSEVSKLGKSVSIPHFSRLLPPESLNAATALAVLLGKHFLAKP
jgi:RNA methyltransferase, TrmH family